MFIYDVTGGLLQQTNATPNTANDCMFIRPGATGRTLRVQRFDTIGRGGGLTSLSSIAIRLEKWTTTSSSGGTGITPVPVDPGAQAAKATAGSSITVVTSGTGGPSLLVTFGMSATGPGVWVAQNPDAEHTLEVADNRSIDAFNVSATASLNFEMSAMIAE